MGAGFDVLCALDGNHSGHSLDQLLHLRLVPFYCNGQGQICLDTVLQVFDGVDGLDLTLVDDDHPFADSADL